LEQEFFYTIFKKRKSLVKHFLFLKLAGKILAPRKNKSFFQEKNLVARIKVLLQEKISLLYFKNHYS